MPRNLLDFIWQTPKAFVLTFGGRSSAPPPAPLPPTPAEDPQAKINKVNAEREAQVDAVSGGRRSTVFAGQDGEEENLLALGSMAKKRGSRGGAAKDLGGA